MANLIGITEIREFKSLSENINPALKIDPFVLEAQEFELRPFLGDEFYEALLADAPAFVVYGDLFNGSSYVCGTKTYLNPGIKPMLVYYAYSRIVSKGNTNSTAFGFVDKTNNDSNPISERTLTRLVAQAVSGAKSYENRVRDFLIRNSADYPLFDCPVDNRKTGNNRISQIGGNSRSRGYYRKY